MSKPTNTVATSAGRPSERAVRLGVGTAIVLISLGGFIVLGATERAAADESGGSSSNDFLLPVNDPSTLEPARIKYEGTEGTMSLPNGGVIPISEDLRLHVLVNPYPPSTFDLDVELRLTDVNGQAIDNATITADWDMAFMWHGPFIAEFVPISDGRYISRFDLFMFGPWELVIHVAVPGSEQPRDQSVSIFVWPE